ncbi:MAG TPA: TIGR03067 domain-containing protein [Terriglobia bacterium]|nr:TIGR03067 domain-containing protein [Terriglobia bacterium]
MRMLTVILAGSLLAMNACSKTGVSPTHTPPDDAKKLQGTWKLTRAIFSGERLSGDASLTIHGDQYIMIYEGNLTPSVFKLGTAGPNTIWVFHHDESPLASQGFWGGTLTGIYELSGDRLRICFDLTGRIYPKTFAAGKGSGQGIFEYKREKSD